jgi:hypothetical protein
MEQEIVNKAIQKDVDKVIAHRNLIELLREDLLYASKLDYDATDDVLEIKKEELLNDEIVEKSFRYQVKSDCRSGRQCLVREGSAAYIEVLDVQSFDWCHDGLKPTDTFCIEAKTLYPFGTPNLKRFTAKYKDYDGKERIIIIDLKNILDNGRIRDDIINF